MVAHGIVYGRTILNSGHPAASAALILATGIVRLSNALALPLLLDFALVDILAWLRSPGEIEDEAPCWDEGMTFHATRRLATPTAIALAFERARQLQEAGR